MRKSGKSAFENVRSATSITCRVKAPPTPTVLFYRESKTKRIRASADFQATRATRRLQFGRRSSKARKLESSPVVYCVCMCSHAGVY